MCSTFGVHYRGYTPSFRKGLGVGYICCFLRFSFSFTPLIPCLLPPRDEREKTERTPTQLPANKKCCLLIFAIAISCLVLAAIPASFPPFSFLSAVMLSRFRPRVPPRLYTLHPTLYTLKSHNFNKFCDFICPYQKFVVYLRL